MKNKFIFSLSFLSIATSGIIGTFALTSCSSPKQGGDYTIKDNDDKYFLINNGNLLGFKSTTADKECLSHHYGKFIFPQSIKTIEHRAFWGKLTFRDTTCKIIIQFDSNLTTIGDHAFDSCGGITELDFSKTTEFNEIGTEAFYGVSLNKVIPGGGIEEKSVTNCGNEFHVFGLQSFTPNYVNTPFSLSGCGCLAYGVFAPSSTSPIAIAQGAFWGCAGIVQVDFSGVNKITNIGKSAFDGCFLNKVIPGGGIEEKSVTNCGNEFHVFGLQSFTPNYVNTPFSLSGCGCLVYGKFAPISGSTSIIIGESAFDGCGGITEVDFSQCLVNNILSGAFWGCCNVKIYRYNRDQKHLTVRGDTTFRDCSLTGKVLASSLDLATEFLWAMTDSSAGWMFNDGKNYWIAGVN